MFGLRPAHLGDDARRRDCGRRPRGRQSLILDRPAVLAQAKTWEFIFWVLPSSLDVPGQPAQPATFYSLHASCRVRDETSGLALCRLALSRGLCTFRPCRTRSLRLPSKGSCRREWLRRFSGNENKTFVIYVDHSVGNAISMTLNGVKKERPLTHDLIGRSSSADVTVERIVINDVSDGTFFARIILHMQNELATRSLRSTPARAIPSCSPPAKKAGFRSAQGINAVEDMTEILERVLKQQSEEVEEEEEDDEEDEKS